MNATATATVPATDVPAAIEESVLLVEDVLNAIMPNPDAVKIRADEQGDHSILVQAQVHPDDVGIAIGTSGRNAFAIQTLLNCLGSRYRVKYKFYVLDKGDKSI
jgi:predicted RNA-binding protein YlqC (UPF0109 family)